MPRPDPKAVISEIDRVPTNAEQRAGVNPRSIVRDYLYADGRLESWARSPGQDPQTTGVQLSQSIDAEQRKAYEQDVRNADAEDKANALKLVTMPDGTKATFNPATGQLTPQGGQTAGQQHAGESVTDPATGEVVGFYDPTGRFIATRHTAAGGSAVGGAAAGGAPVEAPGIAAERAARTSLLGLQAQEAQQRLLPAQQLLIQNHFRTIDALQQMLSQGQLTPEEANAYMAETKQSLSAALQGTTPFQMQEAQLRHQGEQQTLGRDLIGQRLQSGHALASSLLSSAASLADRAMLPEGQSFGINPLKMAMAFTNELGGGEAVGKLAQSLLTGANPQSAPVAGTPQPAANPAADIVSGPGGNGPTSGDLPMTRSEVLARYPELGGQHGPQTA